MRITRQNYIHVPIFGSFTSGINANRSLFNQSEISLGCIKRRVVEVVDCNSFSLNTLRCISTRDQCISNDPPLKCSSSSVSLSLSDASL